MKKDFDNWNEKKKQLDNRENAPFYHEREVWWCSLGVNIGFEQDGSGKEHRRPVLILKGLSREICLTIPLTTALSDHPMRPSVGLVEGKEARALLSQIRVIDSKRLVRKIGYLDKDIFEYIRTVAKELL
ncbi:MAG: type II toxin-antitoxin system PemK/MazF family toxin [bacterium]|nr:type II toxin-antitoxin system PemK/MazF family toxin [bacterium]